MAAGYNEERIIIPKSTPADGANIDEPELYMHHFASVSNASRLPLLFIHGFA
jgi:hypothetical protein